MRTRRCFNFGKVDANHHGRKINEVVVEVEYRARENDGKMVFSSSGEVWNSKRTDIIMGGQCLDSLKKYIPNNILLNTIVHLWERNHLNDMHAGTREQEKCLKDFASEKETIRNELRNNAWNKAKIEFKYSENYFKEWQNWNSSKWDSYTVDCELLKRHGMYEVEKDGEPYKYGHGWIYYEIDDYDKNLIGLLLDDNKSKEQIVEELKALRDSNNLH